MIRLSVESKLLIMLLFVSIASILGVSLISYSGAKAALTQAVYNQLTSVRASRTTQVEDLFKTVQLQALNLADFRTIIDMMKGLDGGVTELQEVGIPATFDQSLNTYYKDDFLPRLQKVTGKVPILEAYLPRTPAARYLQYWYDSNNKYPVGEKWKLDEPGDGSVYSTFHKKYQTIIAKFVTDFKYDNLILVDNTTGDVVYDFAKSPILGTNLLNGPYSDSNAADLFHSLMKVKDRDVVKAVDFAPFAPSDGRPVALVGTAIFDGPEEVGVLMIQFPVETTNRVMTGGEKWEMDGLGSTGETYLVGPDMLMRSRSRLLFQDPARFYDDLKAADYPAEEIERVRRAGTATMAQRSQTTSTEQALAGHSGTQLDTNYLGQSVLTSYAPLDIPGLHWAIVANMDAKEAFAPLNALTMRILISTVVIILLVSFLAVFLGRLFVRPLYRLINRVREMNAGTAVLTTQKRSSDEFGDLADAFDVMYERLGTTRTQLDQVTQERDSLWAHLLPAPIASGYRAGQHQMGERFEDASVLFADLSGLTELTNKMTSSAALAVLNDLIDSLDGAAERFGVEKLRSVGGTYLAVAGLPVQRLDHAIRIVDFAHELRRLVIRARSDRGIVLSVRIGLASGSILAGIVGETRMTYDVWGETVDLAKALAGAAQVNAILVSSACQDLLQDLYRFDLPVEIVVPAGQTAIAWPLILDVDERDADLPAPQKRGAMQEISHG